MYVCIAHAHVLYSLSSLALFSYVRYIYIIRGTNLGEKLAGRGRKNVASSHGSSREREIAGGERFIIL